MPKVTGKLSLHRVPKYVHKYFGKGLKGFLVYKGVYGLHSPSRGLLTAEAESWTEAKILLADKVYAKANVTDARARVNRKHAGRPTGGENDGRPARRN